MKRKEHLSGGDRAARGPHEESGEAAQALAASELRYRRLFESAKDGILILDAETGMVVDVNPFLTGLLGYSREEFLGKRIWELGFFRNLAANADKFAELQAKEYVRYENLPLETVDGQIREVEFVSNVYLAGGQRVIQCNIRDITERKRVEKALVVKTMLLEAQKEASPDGILAVDNKGHALLLNTRFSDIWRLPQHIVDSHDDKAMLEYASKQLKDPEAFHRTIAHLYEHKEETSRDEVYLLDGRCFDRYSSPLIGADGAIRGRIWYFSDITERKRAEQEEARLSDQLRQAQKMEAVGRLAGGVAHDFNNLLMGIMGYAELCRNELGPDHPSRHWLEEIIEGAEKSATITRQLLAFARKQTIAPKVLDLNDATAGMLKLLRRMIGEDIQLTWRPGAELRPVKIDPSQVDQLLANLCVNARDAIGGVGEVIIETGSATMDAAYCADHADATPGAYVCLSVSDNGRGMDKETIAQVFEPFFTTKGLGKGAGLGLATVYGIVRQNQGFVYVYSEPGNGTTFKVYLPEVAAEAVENTTATAKKEDPRGRGETILLVEDEKSVRVTCGLFLASLGYRVMVAATPGEALKMATAHPEDIDLLLTDVVMPGMDGRQMAQRIGELKPRVKTLFMSGYTADVIAQRGVLDEGVHFLSKPFTRSDLAGKVWEALDSVVQEHV